MLSKLPKCYEIVREVCDMHPTLLLADVKKQVYNSYSHRQSTEREEKALASKMETVTPKHKGSHCGKTGHSDDRCWHKKKKDGGAAANRKGGEASQWGGQDKKGKKENQDPVCYLCNLPGHVKDCPSKAGTAGARLKWWLQTR